MRCGVTQKIFPEKRKKKKKAIIMGFEMNSWGILIQKY